MAEAFFREPHWREPALLGKPYPAEECDDISHHIEDERWVASPFQGRANISEQSAGTSSLTLFEDDIRYVLIAAEACSSRHNSLSVFADPNEPGWTDLIQGFWNKWKSPGLTMRSDNESITTVEAQLKRLESCCGTEIANWVRAELKQQIDSAEEQGAAVPVGALMRLVDFLCAHPRLKPPFLFLGSETIKAQWQPSSDEIAWIQFDSTEHVRILAFSPEPRAAGGIKRVAANSTIQSAYRDLLKFGVTVIGAKVRAVRCAGAAR